MQNDLPYEGGTIPPVSADAEGILGVFAQLPAAAERSVGFSFIDSAWRFTAGSSAWPNSSGISPKELIGFNIWELFPEVVGSDFHQECLAVMNGREETRFCCQTEDGAYVEFIVFPAADGIGVIGFDVTADVGLQRELAVSRDANENLIRYAPAGIFEVDLRVPRLTSVNDALCDMSGYSREELLAANPFDLVDPVSIPALQLRLAEVLQGEKRDRDIECKVIRRDRGEMYLSLQCQYVEGEQGQVQSAFVIAHDVTGARRTNEALWESVERFALLSEANSVLLTSPDPVAMIQSIGAKVMAHLDCDVFLNYLLTESGETLSLNAHSGIDEATVATLGTLRLNTGITGRTVYEGKRVIAEDVLAGGDRRTEPLRMMGIQAYASIPLRTRGSTIGALSFGTKKRASFFEDEIMLMQTIADQFSAAIERANAEAEMRANLSRTKVMERLASTVASCLDSLELAEGVLLVMRQQLGADIGAVYLLEDPQGPAKRLAHFGYLSDAVAHDEVELDHSTLAGVAMLTSRIQAAAEGQLPPGTYQWAHSAGVEDHRFVAFPVGENGRPIGVVRLGFPGVRPFGEDELDLFQAVGHQLSVGFERARLFDAQRDIAETLQETLIVVPSHVPGINFSRAYESATYQSGRVGGDFIDVFEAHGHWVGIALGDVSGKGIEAAVTTSLIRNTLRVHALDGQPVSRVVSKANQLMRRFSETESFVTLWFGMLNVRTGQLRYVSAGHPPAYIVSREGEIQELSSRDPIIGVVDAVLYADRQALMVPGDRLVLYSDGVTEARSPDGTFLDDAGLLALLEVHSRTSTLELAPALMEGVVSLSEGVLRDDAAILVVEATKLHNQQAVTRSEERLFED